MEQFPSMDYAGAAATYTPWVLAVLQIAKQSPKVDNSKLPYYAAVLGIIMAIAMLAVAGKLMWTPQGFLFDPIALFKSLIEGFVGGAAAPMVYNAQKQLPIVPLTAGPDNFGRKPTPLPLPPEKATL